MLTRFVVLLALLLAPLAAPAATTRNDDSCDIGLAPAATLLLPYFEVDLGSRSGENTIFTITNTAANDQIAHVTIWTDYAYPVLSFDLFLTGYDAQGINLYDLLVLGRIAPPFGTGTTVSYRGDFSGANPALNLAQCDTISSVPPNTLTRVQQALTVGRVPGCDIVGSDKRPSRRATGYATIDVVSACRSQLTPADPAYYDGMLRYDNVLTGDYQQINVSQNFAQGSPLVHIRAIPEGGTAGERAANPHLYKVNFPRTFYGRYQSGASTVSNARQPLPTVFAARWIAGGTVTFNTDMIIWREATAGPNAPCAAYGEVPSFAETATFDAEESVAGFVSFCPVTCLDLEPRLASAGRYSTTDRYVFPRAPRASLTGWIYLNLARRAPRQPLQAWVAISMRAEGRYSATLDAAMLGNGCSPAADDSEVKRSTGITIGPLPNGNP
ncbi:MAG: hypothetical protein M3Q69_19590 [Acidobacteriota bacterium]|nr:hypothetical protein [Acidobacteriota bacterium]